MPAESDTGGRPETIGCCTDCGNVYGLRRRSNGELYSVGNAGECSCGNDEFDAISNPGPVGG